MAKLQVSPITTSAAVPATETPEYWIYKSQQVMANANRDVARITANAQMIGTGIQVLGNTIGQGLTAMYQNKMAEDRINEQARQFNMDYNLRKMTSEMDMQYKGMQLQTMADAFEGNKTYRSAVNSFVGSALDAPFDVLDAKLSEIDRLQRDTGIPMPTELSGVLLAARETASKRPDSLGRTYADYQVANGPGASEVQRAAWKFASSVTKEGMSVASADVQEGLTLGLVTRSEATPDLTRAVALVRSGNPEVVDHMIKTSPDLWEKAHTLVSRAPVAERAVASLQSALSRGKLKEASDSYSTLMGMGVNPEATAVAEVLNKDRKVWIPGMTTPTTISFGELMTTLDSIPEDHMDDRIDRLGGEVTGRQVKAFFEGTIPTAAVSIESKADATSGHARTMAAIKAVETQGLLSGTPLSNTALKTAQDRISEDRLSTPDVVTKAQRTWADLNLSDLATPAGQASLLGRVFVGALGGPELSKAKRELNSYPQAYALLVSGLKRVETDPEGAQADIDAANARILALTGDNPADDYAKYIEGNAVPWLAKERAKGVAVGASDLKKKLLHKGSAATSAAIDTFKPL